MAEIIPNDETSDINSMISDLERMAEDGGDDAVTAGAGDDKTERLTRWLITDTKRPADQVAAGQVPKAPSITVFPRNATDREVLASYNSLANVNAMLQLYINMMSMSRLSKENNDQGYDITTQAAIALNKQAQATWDALSGPLGGFFNFTQGSWKTYNKNISKSETHAMFLGEIFNGYGFDPSTMKSLDSILTNFANAIKDLNRNGQQTTSEEFAVRLNLCPKINVSGDPDNVVNIYQPTMWIIHIRVDGNTYTQAMNKASSAGQIQFKFEYTVTKCQLDAPRLRTMKEKFNRIMQMIVNKDLDQYGQDLLQQYQIKTDLDNLGATAGP